MGKIILYLKIERGKYYTNEMNNSMSQDKNFFSPFLPIFPTTPTTQKSNVWRDARSVTVIWKGKKSACKKYSLRRIFTHTTHKILFHLFFFFFFYTWIILFLHCTIFLSFFLFLLFYFTFVCRLGLFDFPQP